MWTVMLVGRNARVRPREWSHRLLDKAMERASALATLYDGELTINERDKFIGVRCDDDVLLAAERRTR